MKKQILFVQGGGKGAWQIDAELVASLRKELGPDYEIRYPRMPYEDDPDATAWKRQLADEIAALGDGAILVAHSIGGTILVDFLAKAKRAKKIAGLFLVAAPFVGEGGWESDAPTSRPDFARGPLSDVPTYLYHGREDQIAPFGHVELYAKALPQAVVRRVDGRDHQLDGDLAVVARDIRGLG